MTNASLKIPLVLVWKINFFTHPSKNRSAPARIMSVSVGPAMNVKPISL